MSARNRVSPSPLAPLLAGTTLLLLLFVSGTVAQPELVNDNVVREIDLTSHIVRISTRVTVRNKGTEDATQYELAFSQEDYSQLAHFSVLDADDRALPVSSKTNNQLDDVVLFSVSLPEPLGAREAAVITIESIYAEVQTPFPHEVAQEEEQLMVYSSNVYYYSSYPTTTSQTIALLPNSNVKHFTEEGTTRQEQDKLIYGPYKQVAAYSTAPLRLHYQTSNPYMSIDRVTREIWVSHYGAVNVEDLVKNMRNIGASLKGGFSRLDLQHKRATGNSLRNFEANLPVDAFDVYYRDYIGNISTSNLRQEAEGKLLELQPRFPIFGGWKTTFCVSYDSDTGEYQLSIPLTTDIDEVYVRESETQIMLPEGATVVAVRSEDSNTATLPYELTTSYSHLDTLGRPTVVIRQTRIVPENNFDVIIRYTYPSYMLLWKPILIMAAIVVLCATIMVYVRLNLSITSKPASAILKARANFLPALKDQLTRVRDAYTKIDEAVSKFVQAGKVDSNQLNKLSSELRRESEAVAKVVADCVQQDPLLKTRCAHLTELLSKRQNAHDEFRKCTTEFVTGRSTANHQQALKAKLDFESFNEEIDTVVFEMSEEE